MSEHPARQVVRLWDPDLNLLHTHEGDISTFLGELTVTVDEDPAAHDWRKRKAGRIRAVDVRWLGRDR